MCFMLFSQVQRVVLYVKYELKTKLYNFLLFKTRKNPAFLDPKFSILKVYTFMLYILQNDLGNLAIVASMARFSRVMPLDARLRLFENFTIAAQLPIAANTRGLNQVIRTTAQAVGAVYPDCNSKHLALVNADGEVLAKGDKIAIGKHCNVPRWTVMKAHLRQEPLQWAGKGWVVHQSVQC